MASMQMGLMAVSLGLGTCYCGLLDFAAGHSGQLREAMALSTGHRVPISLMLDYPELEHERPVARGEARVTRL